MSDYLHFGRLIGERPEDVQGQLQATSIPLSRDDNNDAEEYLERCAALGSFPSGMPQEQSPRDGVDSYI